MNFLKDIKVLRNQNFGKAMKRKQSKLEQNAKFGKMMKKTVGNTNDTIEIMENLNLSHVMLTSNVSEYNSPLITITESLMETLEKYLKKMGLVKVQFGIIAHFTNEDGESKSWNVSNQAVKWSPTLIEDGIEKLNEKLEIYTHLSSNWRVTHIIEVSMVLTKYIDIIHVSGSSYIPSPKELEKSKATVNVQNKDNLCFLYSILAVLKYDSIERNRQRASKYINFLPELKYKAELMPMQLINISNFEALNPGLAINVFQYNDNIIENGDQDEDIYKNPNVDIIRRSNKEGKQIYLILLEKDENFHYVAVTNLNRLLNSRLENVQRIQSHWCEICLHGFQKRPAYEKHKGLCKKNIEPTTLFEMPENKFIRFQDWSKTIKHKFVVYADFESILPPDVKYFQRHEPVAAGCCLLFENKLVEYMQYVGEHCIFDFLKWIENITTKIVYPWFNENSKFEMQPLSTQEKWEYSNSKSCYLCKEACEELVKDHDHFTGRYLGAACNQCNLARRIKPSLSVVFHNLRGYDMHHILKYALSRFKDWTTTCIPQTMEKYISLIVYFKKMTVRFIDSLMFLKGSLANLSNTLVEKPLTSSAFNMDFMDGKGVFPFNLGTSLDVLTSTEELPPIWENCSQKEYEKAQMVWQFYHCKNLLEYMLIYMKLDVFLLADIFETFREKSLEDDGLEPLAFFSIPGMSYLSAIKRLEKPIELIQDPEMYKFFEGGIRGGMTFVNKHRIVSNENTELLYVDVNNLYGWALSQKLPCGEFEWIEDEMLMSECLERCKANDPFDGDFAYTLEVDIETPDEIQDKLDDLPVAPMLQCPPNSKVKKLLLTHEPKYNYVVHCRLLQIWLYLGVKVTKVHRIVKFQQREIFKEYIDINTSKRAATTNAFYKDFFKLKNNSLYGKMVENLKKRLNVRFTNNSKKLITYTSKPQFRRSMVIDKDLVVLLLAKERVTLDRPSYIGQSVLDLSKVRMYQLQYQDLEWYRDELQCEINIVAGDTDSFFLECKEVNIEKDLLPRMIDDGLLDTSNYNKDHPLYSREFDSKIGLIKDENKGSKYKEWVFLKPKCYSLLGDKESMKAKGVNLKNTEIRHQTYVNVYETGEIVSVNQERIGSINHQLYTMKFSKVALSGIDNKRCWIGKNKSLAYGHYLINCDNLSDYFNLDC